MVRSPLVLVIATLACAGAACVPSGKAPPWDAGAPKKTIEIAAFEPSANVMSEPFADDFTRDGGAIGDDWLVLDTKAW